MLKYLTWYTTFGTMTNDTHPNDKDSCNIQQNGTWQKSKVKDTHPTLSWVSLCLTSFYTARLNVKIKFNHLEKNCFKNWEMLCSGKVWQKFMVPIRSLCNGDLDRNIKFECFDHNKVKNSLQRCCRYSCKGLLILTHKWNQSYLLSNNARRQTFGHL